MIGALCEDGYTINFYPRNVPPSKKWIAKGNSPTKSQIIFVLDALPGQYYTCGMYNLFISEKFLRASYAEKKYNTMVHAAHGLFRKKGSELPNFVVQEDYKKDRNC